MSLQQQQAQTPIQNQAQRTQQRRHAPQQSQQVVSTPAAGQATQSLPHLQPPSDQSTISERWRSLRWMEEIKFTFNLLNLTITALAFAAAVAYGTKTILQADLANHYGKQSRDIALWQACVSNPDNPQIASSKWCAAHTTSNFDSQFAERDIPPPSEEYTLSVPAHFHMPPELTRDSCRITCLSRSNTKSFADGKKIRWERKKEALTTGSITTVIALFGTVLYMLRNQLVPKASRDGHSGCPNCSRCFERQLGTNLDSAEIIRGELSIFPSEGN